jgi:hypothetical protein
MHGKHDNRLEDIEHELRHLRALVREVGEHFILRHEGAIETIISNLESVPQGKLKAGMPGWLQNIRSLRLKPAKGRLKDLKGIVSLIEELTEQVICAQEGRTSRGDKPKG